MTRDIRRRRVSVESKGLRSRVYFFPQERRLLKSLNKN